MKVYVCLGLAKAELERHRRKETRGQRQGRLRGQQKGPLCLDRNRCKPKSHGKGDVLGADVPESDTRAERQGKLSTGRLDSGPVAPRGVEVPLHKDTVQKKQPGQSLEKSSSSCGHMSSQTQVWQVS